MTESDQDARLEMLARLVFGAQEPPRHVLLRQQELLDYANAQLLAVLLNLRHAIRWEGTHAGSQIPRLSAVEGEQAFAITMTLPDKQEPRLRRALTACGFKIGIVDKSPVGGVVMRITVPKGLVQLLQSDPA